MRPGVKPPGGSIRIGSVIEGSAGSTKFQGKPLAPKGYDHFR
jgi:hypothetical protein